MAQFVAQTHLIDNSDSPNQWPEMPGPTQILNQIQVQDLVTQPNWVEFSLGPNQIDSTHRQP